PEGESSSRLSRALTRPESCKACNTRDASEVGTPASSSARSRSERSIPTRDAASAPRMASRTESMAVTSDQPDGGSRGQAALPLRVQGGAGDELDDAPREAQDDELPVREGAHGQRRQREEGGAQEPPPAHHAAHHAERVGGQDGDHQP